MFDVNANKAKQMKMFGPHLFNGSDRDDKEERQSAGDRTGGSVDDQLKSHTHTHTDKINLCVRKLTVTLLENYNTAVRTR